MKWGHREPPGATAPCRAAASGDYSPQHALLRATTMVTFPHGPGSKNWREAEVPPCPEWVSLQHLSVSHAVSCLSAPTHGPCGPAGPLGVRAGLLPASPHCPAGAGTWADQLPVPVVALAGDGHRPAEAGHHECRNKGIPQGPWGCWFCLGASPGAPTAAVPALGLQATTPYTWQAGAPRSSGPCEGKTPLAGGSALGTRPAPRRCGGQKGLRAPAWQLEERG